MSRQFPKTARERFAKLYRWSAVASIAGKSAGEKQVQKLRETVAEWGELVIDQGAGGVCPAENLLCAAAGAFSATGPSKETAGALSAALAVARAEIKKRGEDPKRWYEKGQYA